MKPNTKTKVVNIGDIKRFIHMNNPLGTVIASILMKALGFCTINTHYARFAKYQGKDFTDNCLKDFNISYDIKQCELDYIPQEGPFIIVSNHPFGGVDGLILFSIIASIRPDFKILTNFMLSHIPNLKDYFLPVNPFSENKKLKKSFSGLRAAREHVELGGALGLFPSGEVSTFYGKKKYVADKEWQNSMIKLIKSCGVPVVPVYFHGTNSRKFHMLGRINPLLRTIRLPKELIRKSGQCIPMRISRAVSPNELSEYSDLRELGKYLNSRTYALEANIPKISQSSFQSIKEGTPIVLPRNKNLIVQELEAIENTSLFFEVANYQCFLADYDQIPNLIHEIGRKREETFRAVGEGTNNPIDLDKYDPYYKHMILWDKQKKNIAGAYRLGIGYEIIEKYGIEGFYANSLFSYPTKNKEILSETIELGRSFVAVEYQKEALPMMLLIKGLMFTIMKYRRCNYFIGPVSISSWYPRFYQSLMIYYLLSKHSTEFGPKLVKSRTPFVPDYLRVDVDALLSKKMDSIEKFDRFMLRLSDNEYRVPTLVKKYIKLGCNLLCFNVDKDFNYCVDGLILLKYTDIPKDELMALTKGCDNVDEILERFGYGTGS